MSDTDNNTETSTEGDDGEDTTTDTTTEGDDGEHQGDGDTFPRKVVEDLRKENARYRDRAKTADGYAQRLHAQLVGATGRLADPSDLAFDEVHLDDPEALTTAIDELLTRKPHLASRKPTGDIGQGQRGTTSGSFSLLDMLKERT